MNALTRFRAVALALGVVLAAGCSTDEASSPTAPPTTPVPPPVGINVSVTASNSSLEVDSTTPSIITIRAIRADNGQPVPNLTQATVTTTLGGFGAVGGPQTTTVELINGEAQVTLFAGGTIGTATVRAQVSGGVGITSVNVRERGTGGAFFVQSVTPNTGSPQGGEAVTIHGGGFSDPIRVTFDGVPAQIQSASETAITVTTPPLLNGLPPGGTQAVTVAVTINRNTPEELSDSLPSGFIYTNGPGGTLQPTIFSVTPASGPNEGGTQVTINGDGFEAPVQVKFGTGSSDGNFNGAEAQVLSVTRTRVVVVAPPTSCATCAPPIPNQLVNILVKNQATSRFTVATSAFRYGSQIIITAISPTQGPPEGGTLVTIYGQGFDEPVAVSIGGQGQQVVSVSGSQIVIRTVPIVVQTCANGGGAVSVTNIETGESAVGPAFSFLVSRPTISSASPGSGSQSGGTSVTINGSNFSAPVLVEFIVGGSTFTGSVTSTSSTSIHVQTPSIPNSAMDTATCDENGDPVPPDPTPDPDGEKYLPTSANVKVTNTVSGCSVTLNGGFLFNPTDSSCRGD
jgi:hypothetical protein